MTADNIPITEIVLDEFSLAGHTLHIWRGDLGDPCLNGNKPYKLKYNLDAAEGHGCDCIVTFGGAFSNHIAATAAAAKLRGMKSAGIIRGEAESAMNPTLSKAARDGMELRFVSRETYRQKDDPTYLEKLREEFPLSWIVPEGGSNEEGLRGAMDMLDERTAQFDVIALAVGTGTTFAGLACAATPHQKVIGIPVHRHAEISKDKAMRHPEFSRIDKMRWEIATPYHRGGYAQWDTELVSFIRQFHNEQGILLDPIYTAKAMLAIIELMRSRAISRQQRVLFMHTGGLQGIDGFEERFGFKLLQ